MKKKRWLAVLIIFVLALGLLLAFPFSRSLIIMSVYSAAENQDSVLKQEDIHIHLPGGLSTPEKDWYPLVITYNADYFGAYVNRPVDLTILYNFGAFDASTHCSTFYDPTSDFSGAFYGAYVIKSHDGSVYGYGETGELNTEEMAKVFKYDMNILVLKSLGCSDPSFEYTLTDQSTKTIDGYVFDVVDAQILTQSPLHSVSTFQSAYYQYGSPKNIASQKDFKNTRVYGRIYAYDMPERNITLCFYIIAPNQQTIIKCEQSIIEKATISFN